LQRAPTMGGVKETLWGLQRHFSPLLPTIIIINDYKEEEHVEKRTTKAKAKAKQHVEIE
jgi:hypothetical protein